MSITVTPEQYAALMNDDDPGPPVDALVDRARALAAERRASRA